jgi:hypothetical protein
MGKDKSWYWLCQNISPICPYCEKKQSLDDVYLSGGEEWNGQCESCEKHIRITAVVSTTYDTHGSCEKNGEMPHNLYRSEYDKVGPYTCQGCYMEFYDWQFPEGKYPQLKAGEFVLSTTPADKESADD